MKWLSTLTELRVALLPSSETREQKMSRPSTLPGPWLDLSNAVGGIQALCNALGWPYMVLFRRTRNLVKIPKADRMLIEQLAKQHNVPSPLSVDNLEPLEMLGHAMEIGFPPAVTEVDRVRKNYTEEDLLKLAEADGISPTVLRAVSHLLGL